MESVFENCNNGVSLRRPRMEDTVFAEFGGVSKFELYRSYISISVADQYNEHKRLGQAEVHHDDLLSLWYVYFVSHFFVGVIHSVNLIFLSEYLQ